MRGDHVLALDVGTSGVKVVATDAEGRIVASAIRSYGLTTGGCGMVDQDLDEILAASKAAIRAVVDDLPGHGSAIAVASVTAQMFNMVPVDASGRPLLPMLSWLDQRSEPDARLLAARMPDHEQFAKLGAVVSGKDILPKILWLRDRRPDVYAATSKLLDCKEAVVMALTGEPTIDRAGASAYRLFDHRARAWDVAACAEVGVDPRLLPDVLEATDLAGGITGAVARDTGLRAGTPVVVGAGDVPASQVGAGAIGIGDAHVSLGTAVYYGITLADPAPDPNRRLGVIAHVIPDAWILWLEIATGGGALAWLARTLRELGSSGPIDYAAIDALVTGCADEMEDLLFAPWLSGERVPVFDDRARGAFVGIGLNHRPAHLFRAVMEGVAFQMRWALEYGQEFGRPLNELRAVGGGTIGHVWMQLIADVLARPIDAIARPQDAAAVGAAASGLVGIGLKPDFGFVRTLATVDRTFEPDASRRGSYDDRYRRFRQLYSALSPLFHGVV